jgi:hypothetical protein
MHETEYATMMGIIQRAAPPEANAFTVGRRRGRPTKGQGIDLRVQFHELSAEARSRAASVQRPDGLRGTALVAAQSERPGKDAESATPESSGSS